MPATRVLYSMGLALISAWMAAIRQNDREEWNAQIGAVERTGRHQRPLLPNCIILVLFRPLR